MKKKTLITITLFLLIFILAGSFLFIKNARENRSWPFNSSLSNYLPKSIKYFAYKFTNPDQSILETYFYDLSIDYYSIPSSNSVGNGGGLDVFDEKNMLTVLDNGEIFLFDSQNLKFNKIKHSKLEKNYASIRDIYYKNNELLVLAVKKTNNEDCSIIIVDRYLKANDSENKTSLNFSKTIWSSENLCEDTLVNNAGGRIIKFRDKIYISTGYFTPYINSGINAFPQNKDSSFGKILEIDNQGKGNIYSMGHRNPQGLFLYDDDQIISSEHGPRGGDELNLIEKNKNYGWPCETQGTLYSYENTGLKKEIWLDAKQLKNYGCNQIDNYTKPLYSWTPSIAASQAIQYQGDYFDIFKRNIILGSLGGLSLFRIILEDKKIINIERINVNERIRDIAETYDGKIMLYTDGGNVVLLSKNSEKIK